MVAPPDIEARILRLYHAEKWLIGTIAQQLHVHYSVVGRVLAQAGLPRPGPPPCKSRIDPYLAFIRQTLETFPALTASRLYVMVRERGYRGSPDHFPRLSDEVTSSARLLLLQSSTSSGDGCCRSAVSLRLGRPCRLGKPGSDPYRHTSENQPLATRGRSSVHWTGMPSAAAWTSTHSRASSGEAQLCVAGARRDAVGTDTKAALNSRSLRGSIQARSLLSGTVLFPSSACRRIKWGRGGLELSHG